MRLTAAEPFYQFRRLRLRNVADQPGGGIIARSGDDLQRRELAPRLQGRHLRPEPLDAPARDERNLNAEAAVPDDDAVIA